MLGHNLECSHRCQSVFINNPAGKSDTTMWLRLNTMTSSLHNPQAEFNMLLAKSGFTLTKDVHLRL